MQRVTEAIFLELERPGREADHSPPPSAEENVLLVELYLHSPNTPLWRISELKKAHG
jgi:hypothetical protein